MESFKNWLKTQESSAFTRRRSAAARGLAPPIPDASLHSRSTCPPAELEMVKDKKKGKKKKKSKKKVVEESESKPDLHIDKWLSSVDNLKRDLDDLKSKKPDDDEDELGNLLDDEEDDDELNDLLDDEEDDDELNDLLDDEDLDDESNDESSPDDEAETDEDDDLDGEDFRMPIRPDVGGSGSDFGLRRLPRDQVEKFVNGV